MTSDASRQRQGEAIMQTNDKALVFVASMELSQGIRFDRENLVMDILINHRQSLEYLHFRLFPEATNENQYVGLSVHFLADGEANFLTEGEWTTLHLSLSNGTLVCMTAQDCQKPIRHLRVLLEDLDDNALDGVEVQFRNVKSVPRSQRGCISLHFDDGYPPHLQLVAALLKRYSTADELKATAFVMPRQLGLPGYLTPDEVQQLVNEYGWEIGAHHHQALTQMQASEFTQEMEYLVAFFKQWGWAKPPIHFAYPLGKMNRGCRQGVQQYFASGRLIAGGPETLPPADWYRLRTINVTPLTPARELAQIAQWTIENGGWAIYMFHHIVEDPQSLTEYAQTEFEQFLKFLQEQAYRTTSMAELYE